MTVKGRFWVVIGIIILFIILQMTMMVAIIVGFQGGNMTATHEPLAVRIALMVGGLSWYFLSDRWLYVVKDFLKGWMRR